MNIPDLRTPQGTAIAVGAAILATIVAAFVIPPGVSGGDAATDGPGGFTGNLPAAVPEDLSGFVSSDRWGVSLEDVLQEVAAENLARRGLNPVLRQMGFLGLMEAGDATAVLLADPELDGGNIIQLAPGDTLPDGRVLAEVTDNSITLTSSPEGVGGSADPTDGRPPGGATTLSTRRTGPGYRARRVVDSRFGGVSVGAHPATLRPQTPDMGRKALRITYSPV